MDGEGEACGRGKGAAGDAWNSGGERNRLEVGDDPDGWAPPVGETERGEVGWAGGEGVGPSRIWAGSGKREKKDMEG